MLDGDDGEGKGGSRKSSEVIVASRHIVAQLATPNRRTVHTFSTYSPFCNLRPVFDRSSFPGGTWTSTF